MPTSRHESGPGPESSKERLRDISRRIYDLHETTISTFSEIPHDVRERPDVSAPLSRLEKMIYEWNHLVMDAAGISRADWLDYRATREGYREPR